MISRPEARERVLAEVRSRATPERQGEEPILLDERTIEREWGWIFFCGLRPHGADSPGAELVPYIVNRRHGSVHAAGTTYPIDHYIRQYENQLERAEGRWALVIHDASPLTARVSKAIRSVLRIKSFEMQEFEARLPGVVRRGARDDLVLLRDGLRAAGVNAELVPHRQVGANEAPAPRADEEG